MQCEVKEMLRRQAEHAARVRKQERRRQGLDSGWRRWGRGLGEVLHAALLMAGALAVLGNAYIWYQGWLDRREAVAKSTGYAEGWREAGDFYRGIYEDSHPSAVTMSAQPFTSEPVDPWRWNRPRVEE